MDWDRALIDDRSLVAFYNFGGWNLLHPRFAAERPNPFHSARDPERFAAFLRAQGVRFAVLSKIWKGFPELAAIARGGGALPGFERIADLPEDAVFAARR